MKSFKITFLFAAISLLLCINTSAQDFSKGKQKENKAEHHFKELDTDKDGYLSLEELQKPLQREFKSLDQNNDGKLSNEEFKNFRPKGDRKGKKTPKQIMNDLDKNKDGKISKEEARGPLKDHFSEVDINNDGFVDTSELKKKKGPERIKPM